MRTQGMFGGGCAACTPRISRQPPFVPKSFRCHTTGAPSAAMSGCTYVSAARASTERPRSPQPWSVVRHAAAPLAFGGQTASPSDTSERQSSASSDAATHVLPK